MLMPVYMRPGQAGFRESIELLLYLVGDLSPGF